MSAIIVMPNTGFYLRIPSNGLRNVVPNRTAANRKILPASNRTAFRKTIQLRINPVATLRQPSVPGPILQLLAELAARARVMLVFMQVHLVVFPLAFVLVVVLLVRPSTVGKRPLRSSVRPLFQHTHTNTKLLEIS